MLDGLLIGALVGLLVMGIGFIVALTSKRSYAAPRPRPARLLHLDLPLPPEAVRERILAALPGTRFKLEEDVPEQDLLTLGTKPTGFSWGFYYPVYMPPNGPNGTRLTVGIASKFFQYGPIVTHNHKAALTFIQQATGG